MYFVCSTHLPIIDGGLSLDILCHGSAGSCSSWGRHQVSAPLGERTHTGWRVCSGAPETWGRLILVPTSAGTSGLLCDPVPAWPLRSCHTLCPLLAPLTPWPPATRIPPVSADTDLPLPRFGSLLQGCTSRDIAERVWEYFYLRSL